ncbi:MAG: response regulator [Deltaproteobacteria bacterium]|nr:response regulator [Deltaproteobacteria bacterium]
MANERARVLVVDDERFFREAIAEVLSANDLVCSVTESGEGALKLAAAQRFAVTLLDVRLPGIDGIEVLRQLRIAQPEMRVIMLSASVDQELVIEALRIGACDYLAKPLHDEELMLAVHRAAEAHKVASDWSSLRTRLDDLVEMMEELAKDVNRAAQGERLRAVRDGATRAVARVLDARKASMLLLNDEGTQLDVVAMVGRDLELDEMDSVRVGQGVAGRALEDSTPLLVADIRCESHFAADLAPDRYETDSFAVAPIELPGRQFGVLCATDRADDSQFGHEDLSLLRLISLQTAELLAGDSRSAAKPIGGDGLDRADLEPGVDCETVSEFALESPSALDPEFSAGEMMPLDLAREVADAASICAEASDADAELARRVCDAVVNEIEPENLLREAVRPIEAALGADPVSLYLIDSESGELVMESQGERGLRLDHARLPCNRGLTGSVLQRGQLIAAADPESNAHFDPLVDTPTDQKAGPLLCVPLQLRGKTVGLCRIHLAPGATVSARTGEVLTAVLSAAVRNVLLYRSLLESIEEVASVRRQARS